MSTEPLAPEAFSKRIRPLIQHKFEQSLWVLRDQCWTCGRKRIEHAS